MYWILQNLKDSENKQQILHYGSIFSAAAVRMVQAQRNSRAQHVSDVSFNYTKIFLVPIVRIIPPLVMLDKYSVCIVCDKSPCTLLWRCDA
jgi:hypothetical protein